MFYVLCQQCHLPVISDMLVHFLIHVQHEVKVLKYSYAVLVVMYVYTCKKGRFYQCTVSIVFRHNRHKHVINTIKLRDAAFHIYFQSYKGSASLRTFYAIIHSEYEFIHSGIHSQITFYLALPLCIVQCLLLKLNE